MSFIHNSDVRASSVSLPTADADLSRTKLRRMSDWIRDELDPVVARDGSCSLLADDVLVLHDFFQSLQTSTKITALDLRATGIHRAILSIAGIATRWPGRLCDDCDNIIKLWTLKFGKLEDLRPFLCGRGGCLEGIASGGELSKQALLRRWEHSCPGRISSNVSHKHGNLGFTAGSWWINSLFAWHAGIIDHNTVDGGICSDKDAAYALFLKDAGELEAPTETHFTYRSSPIDQGVFRLTATTLRSRNPIRVLRSHSLNSTWGPRAGVRYEGLYRVVGWSIHQKKNPEKAQQEYHPTDIVYDIQFERDDPSPMEEVLKVPTAFQVDEFSEYKRLRKAHRELQRHRRMHPGSEQRNAQYIPTKVAPQIAAHGAHVIASSVHQKSIPSSGECPIAILECPIVPGGSNLSSHSASQNTSLMTVPRTSAGHQDVIHLSSNDTAVQNPKDTQQAIANALFSRASSVHTVQSHESDLREVTPWVDFDARVELPLGEPEHPLRRITRGGTRPGEQNTQTPQPSIRSFKTHPREQNESQQNPQGCTTI